VTAVRSERIKRMASSQPRTGSRSESPWNGGDSDASTTDGVIPNVFAPQPHHRWIYDRCQDCDRTCIEQRAPHHMLLNILQHCSMSWWDETIGLCNCSACSYVFSGDEQQLHAILLHCAEYISYSDFALDARPCRHCFKATKVFNHSEKVCVYTKLPALPSTIHSSIRAFVRHIIPRLVLDSRSSSARFLSESIAVLNLSNVKELVAFTNNTFSPEKVSFALFVSSDVRNAYALFVKQLVKEHERASIILGPEMNWETVI
jgi:hypothetical protein